jgi:hypothetical protein
MSQRTTPRDAARTTTRRAAPAGGRTTDPARQARQAPARPSAVEAGGARPRRPRAGAHGAAAGASAGPRPGPTPGTNPLISLRLDPELLARVDAELDRRRQAHPGTTLTRADIVRDALWQTLGPAPAAPPARPARRGLST